MGVMNRLDHRGHGPIAIWDEDEVSRAAAADIFRHQQTPRSKGGGGCVMYDVTNPHDGKILDNFVPEPTEILAVPPLVGG